MGSSARDGAVQGAGQDEHHARAADQEHHQDAEGRGERDQRSNSSGLPVAAGGELGEETEARRKGTSARQRQEGRQVEEGGEGVQAEDKDEPGRRGRGGRWHGQSATNPRKASEEESS